MSPARAPSEFRLPHAIALDEDDRVYVADRGNSGIQVFKSNGEYITEWTHVTRPDDLFIDRDGIMHVAELGEIAGQSPDVEILQHTPPASVCLMDLDGELITRFGGKDPVRPGNFFAPHGIWADSRGDLYVAEVVYSGVAIVVWFHRIVIRYKSSCAYGATSGRYIQSGNSVIPRPMMNFNSA